MKPQIPFSDFEKLDLRVGLITRVEPHPKADKLFVLSVDLGENSERTIVAGLRAFYKPEDLEHKKAIFITNLEPVVLRGVKSEGMILAASNEGKEKVVFLKPESDIEPGSKIS